MTIESENDKTPNEQDELDEIDKEIEEIDGRASGMLLDKPEEEESLEPLEELETLEELGTLEGMGESEESLLGKPEELMAESSPEDGLESEFEPEPVQKELARKPVPVYMLDDPPEGKSNLIKWSLMHEIDEEFLKEQGFNPRSIDICAQELEKAGLRKRPRKSATSTAVTKSGARSPQIFARGSPPEALIEGLAIPGVDGKLEGFDQGMRFGASVIVLGVRIVQELSSLGVQQTKPLIDMANSMRQGEALAAKSAANEAAQEAAGRVQGSMMPFLQSLQKGAEGPDPVKAMMVRTMEPMIQGMLKSLVPGMPQGETNGWTRKQIE